MTLKTWGHYPKWDHGPFFKGHGDFRWLHSHSEVVPWMNRHPHPSLDSRDRFPGLYGVGYSAKELLQCGVWASEGFSRKNRGSATQSASA